MKPKNLEDLRSYSGAVYQMNRFIPNLAEIRYKLRPLLKKDQTCIWEEIHDKALEKMNQQIQKTAEVGHFKISSPFRILSDASRAGVRAVLQQKDEIG